MRETPTVDEFAHVPAGLLHWRAGQFELYRNNPPLGKLWVALPLALDRSVDAPDYDGKGVGWSPWIYGVDFERMHADRYLGLMTRAQADDDPAGLGAGEPGFLLVPAVVRTFCRSHEHGPIAAVSHSAGPWASGDSRRSHNDDNLRRGVCLRWSAAAPGWRRDFVAGGALGLALAMKFSALYLVPLLPLCFAAIVWRSLPGSRVRALAAHLAIYALAAWLALNASMGFAGTFAQLGSLDFRSQTLGSLAARAPSWLPVGLPRAYVEGIDALKEDIEINHFLGYLHGEWSEQGWASYYFIAYGLKETEPVVILTLLSLFAFPLVVRNWREVLLVVAPPAALLLIAAEFNTLCLGIRYILPVYPFLFVMIGSCFAGVERWIERRQSASGRQANPAPSICVGCWRGRYWRTRRFSPR